MTRVTIHAAKTHLSRLAARAEAGETILLVRGRGGEPIARIAPLLRKQRRTPRAGWMQGEFESPDASAFAPMTNDELREWGLL